MLTRVCCCNCSVSMCPLLDRQFYWWCAACLQSISLFGLKLVRWA